MTALLLAQSRGGTLPFVELVPEGYEDIDCADRQSTHWLIQVKEFGAGAGTFTASSVADVIAHAALAPSTPARIVAITDGQLDTQLTASGWNRAVSETPGYDTQSTIAALTRRGYSTAHATALLMRAHLITYPWNTVPLLTSSIAHTYHLKPAVAALVAGRLVDSLGQIAADQRSTTLSSIRRFCPADLDALVQKTQTVVDVHSLDSAVRLGVCDIADYTAQPPTSQSLFLQGIDAIPAHIGSHYDVLRPTPSRAVQHAIETARYALIAGPSGSGKSTQVWRSARDVATAVQVIRVHRVETDRDIAAIGGSARGAGSAGGLGIDRSWRSPDRRRAWRTVAGGRSERSSCGPAGVSTRYARPSLRCGPSGDTPSVPPLKQQIWALRPGLDGGVPALHDNAKKRDDAG